MEDRNVTDVTEVSEGNTDFAHNVGTDVPGYNGKVYRSWCFTLNNYHDDDLHNMESWMIKRLVCGAEIGESGTPHIQGYVTFTRGMRLYNCKKLLPSAHWEVARAIDAENYCMKEGTVLRIDIDNRQQGQRSDLINACKIIKDKGLTAIKNEMPETYVKFHSGFDKLALHYDKERTTKPHVVWLWGPTGSGKTRYVFDKEKDLWVSGRDLRWFDGYENQEAVLFDDFRGDMCQFRVLLRLLDRYPYKVEIKGGTRQWKPERIYITSCKRPDDIYNKETFDNEEKVDQLLRRIDEIIFMNNIDEDFLF